jgi:signal peptidase
MQPTIATGSLVVVVPQGEYQKGDIVTYRQTGTKEAVTHRIVEVSKDEDLGITSYRTQGDANKAPDPELVRGERVIGKVLAHAPFLGYPVGFAQTQTGFIALVIIPASLIVYSELMTAKTETLKAVSGWKAKRAEAKKQAEAEPKKETPVKTKPKLKRRTARPKKKQK